MPEPNYLINSSPDKWQVIWKIAGCGKGEAEGIERGLVADTGADPAVVDIVRVLDSTITNTRDRTWCL